MIRDTTPGRPPLPPGFLPGGPGGLPYRVQGRSGADSTSVELEIALGQGRRERAPHDDPGTRSALPDGFPWVHHPRLEAWQIVRTERQRLAHHQRLLERYKLANLDLQGFGALHSDPGSGFLSSARGQRLIEYQDAYRDWVPLSLWDGAREVFVPHPHFTRELLRSKTDAFPVSLLRTLTWTDPMIVFTEGIPFVFGKGVRGVLRSLVVSGFRYDQPVAQELAQGIDAPRVVVSTGAPDIDGLNVYAVSEVLSDSGARVLTQNGSHMVIPLPTGAQDVTVESVTQASLDVLGADRMSEYEASDVDEYLRMAYRTALTHLLYLASRNADVGTPDPQLAAPPPRNRRSAAASARQERYRPVGYRIGQSVERWNRQQADRASGTRAPAGSSGRVMPPHTRRPHLHGYRVGPGRREIEYRDLGEIEVNKHLRGPDTDVALYPMGTPGSNPAS